MAYCSVIINKNNFILVQSVLFTTFREENKLKLLLPNGLITNSGMVTTFPGYNNSEESFYYLTVAIVLTEQPTTTGVMLELDIGCVVAGKTDTDPYAINSAAVLSVNVVAPLGECKSTYVIISAFSQYISLMISLLFSPSPK